MAAKCCSNLVWKETCNSSPESLWMHHVCEEHEATLEEVGRQRKADDIFLVWKETISIGLLCNCIWALGPIIGPGRITGTCWG
jgi:hypothetical protein